MTYTFTHLGTWISLNAAYGKHYHVRHQEKTRFALVFADLLSAADVLRLAAFTLHLRYNSRMDADNTVAGLKVFCDTMRAVGTIVGVRHYGFEGAVLGAVRAPVLADL